MKERSETNFWFYVAKYAFRSNTWRALMLSIFLLSCYYIFLFYFFQAFTDFEFVVPGFVVYSLGYVIAILFYFRLNNSYYRWTDGNKSMALLRANSESFVMKVRTYFRDDPDAVKVLSDLIKNHYRALGDLVRGIRNVQNLLPVPDRRALEQSSHLPTQLNALLKQNINDAHLARRISRVEFLDLDRNIVKNTEFVSTAESLKATPPPKTYIFHIRGFIVAYALMIPFGFIHEFQAWMLLFLVVFFYFYAGLEVISDEVEDPFGLDENDIPVEQLTGITERRIDELNHTTVHKIS